MTKLRKTIGFPKFLIFAAITVLVVTSIGIAVADDGLVSHWEADGNAEDEEGINDGTLVGGATFAPGIDKQAFSLNGSTAYVEVPDAASLDISSQITIAAWINPNSSGTYRIVDKITAGFNNGYLLDVLGGKLRLIAASSVTGNTTLSTGVFTWVAGTYDGSNLKVYINGALDGTLAASGAIPTNNLTLRIGADSTGLNGSAGNRFPGLIDEVQLYDRVLSAAEIQTLFEAGLSKKVDVCHKDKNTINISRNALEAHLAHGDAEGSC